MVFAHTSPALLIAAGSPDPAFAGSATVYVVAIIVPVLGLLATIVAIVLSNRRNPPVAEEVHKTFVPRMEFSDGVQRLHDRIDKNAEEIAAAKAQFNEDITAARTNFAKAFGDLEHAIGRLEGKMDSMHK